MTYELDAPQHTSPDHNPQNPLSSLNVRASSSTELLAMLIEAGSESDYDLQSAQRWLTEIGGLREIIHLVLDDVMRFTGLDMTRSAQIIAAIELGRRAVMTEPEPRPLIEEAADAARLLADMGHLKQEQVRVMLLDSMQRVQHIETVYQGTVDVSVLRVAEVYRTAIIRNAPAIIVAHNHPSGDAKPSPEDVAITKAIVAAGEMLDIQCLDHLIIGQNEWRSLREMQLGF